MFRFYSRRLAQALTWLMPLCALTYGQSTQSILFGYVYDSREGTAIGAAEILCLRGEVITNRTISDPSGGFFLRDITPGTYTIRAQRTGFQSREVRLATLPVAGYLSLDFRLRPIEDVWEQGAFRNLSFAGNGSVLTYFGPDVERNKEQSAYSTLSQSAHLEATLSHVIDRDTLRHLPLAVRDPYSLLVLLPGISADTTTARGLGLSANGQRPAASHFLLDGADNDNQLVTGPLISLPPESIQEYRVSTHNFSAEFGRTSGFVANVISALPAQHITSTLWSYLGNEALNANGFQQNRAGVPRGRQRERHAGAQTSLPLGKFASLVATYESLHRDAVRDPITLRLPGSQFLSLTAPNSASRRILTAFPLSSPGPPALFLDSVFRPPVTTTRDLASARLTAAKQNNSLSLTFHGNRIHRPDFLWTPYTAFQMPLHQTAFRVAATLTSTPRSNIANYLRAATSDDDLRFDRPYPEVPTLASFDGLVLPGSPAFYSYRNRSRYFQISEQFEITAGSHLWKAGGAYLNRSISGYLTAGAAGLVAFQDFFDFALSRPAQLSVAVSRAALPTLTSPDYDHAARNHQFHAFVQDTVRISPRLNVHLGLRYESFGVPVSTRPNDLALDLASGAFRPAPRQLYSADKNNWAARGGFVYRLTSDNRTTLASSYGLFYDRPYDNLWQNLRSNRFLIAGFPLRQPAYDFLRPISTQLRDRSSDEFVQDFPSPNVYAPTRRDGYLQSAIVSLSRELAPWAALNLYTTYGRANSLITTDIINRPTAGRRPLPRLPYVALRDSAGYSSYRSLAAKLDIRSRSWRLQSSYTWSRTIDVQSDALLGDFFNLDFTRLNPNASATQLSAFTLQGDPHSDLALADFDQRHNAVLFGSWTPPSFLRHWRIGFIAALRSGLPYTVFSGDSDPGEQQVIFNNRADRIAAPDTNVPVDGGRQLLLPTAFREPAPGVLGNAGRNTYRAPMFFSIDSSIGRDFTLRLGDHPVISQFRIDLQNATNRANLNRPDNLLPSPTFGQAMFGRQGSSSGFPALTPLNELPRQILLLLRVQF